MLIMAFIMIPSWDRGGGQADAGAGRAGQGGTGLEVEEYGGAFPTSSGEYGSENTFFF